MLLSCERDEQRSASLRLPTPTCGSHLVPEDVPGDGCCDLHDDHQRQQDGKLGSGGGEKALKKTETGPVLSANQVWEQSVEHRGDHAVVLLPGAAAAEEGDEEDDDPDPDDDDGDAGGRGVVDLVGVVQSDLNHDANNNQGQAAQLQGSEGEVRVQGCLQESSLHLLLQRLKNSDSAAGDVHFPQMNILWVVK